jgi:hypothetical protein
VQNAIAAATADDNVVMNEKASVKPEDVTFPAIDRVQVNVHRTKDRGNPLLPFLAPMFGIDEVDLGASATAQAAPANAMTCVKPFTIPDKWEERQTGPWDPEDSFDIVDDKGNPVANPDVYIPYDQPGYTGYNPQRDRGTRVVIKAGNDTKLYPSFYYPYAVGGESGAAEYRWNIANCNTTMMEWGDPLVSEPGNMSGPTRQGVADLIALDANAYWDAAENRAVSTMHPSPRIVAIPVFDPVYYYMNKQNSRNASLKVANYIGIFVEGMQGNDVVARITPIGGLIKGNAGGPAPSTAFPAAIVLVK